MGVILLITLSSTNVTTAEYAATTATAMICTNSWCALPAWPGHAPRRSPFRPLPENLMQLPFEKEEQAAGVNA